MDNFGVELGGKALGEVLTSLIVKACTVLYGSVTAAPPITIDVGSIMIESKVTGDQIPLTHADLKDIASFLRTPETAAIAQGYVLLACIQNRYEDLDESLRDLKTAFFEHARAWGSTRGERPWTFNPDMVWTVLTENMQLVAPDRGATSRLSKEELARLVDTASAEQRILQAPAPRYIRLVADITRDPTRVTAARELCVDICRAASTQSAEMHLDHAADRHRFSQEDLYIRRSITPRSGPGHEGLETIIDDPLPGARLVVYGHPGVGKSTLVNRLIYSLSGREDNDFAPILIKCRDLGPDLEKSGLDHLLRVVNQDLGVPADREHVEDLLALGRAFAIYDGVDEITDLQQRRKLIGSIELLAQTYGLTSVICTTRKIGYESASFTKGSFPVFELLEYSAAQVEEYSDRWFKLMGRSDRDRIAFLRESFEIDEIRRNPLMLSLLCTLYKVRGFIPMNRRDVYKDCADLLFCSWDSIRRIPQPVDHKRYGHSLMEELADLFFKFPSTAGGIEEKQLTKIIAGFFTDTAGIEPADAESRATDFLSFCAGRAWLLTAKGHSERGQRLFDFTHRTFMEFYAAEALVRRAENQRTVLDIAIGVYKQNPSSVLTDLIFEAYENKQHRGAEMLLRDLMREGTEGRKVAIGTHIPLCLRVLNSTPVGAPLATEILVAAFSQWSSLDNQARFRAVSSKDSQDQKKAFVSLLQLYKDPRRLVERLLLEDDFEARSAHNRSPIIISESVRKAYRLSFLRRWAELAVLGEASAYHDDWELLALRIAERQGREAAESSSAIQLYLAQKGIVPIEPHHIGALPLTIAVFGKSAPGLLIQSLCTVLFGTPLAIHHNVVDAADQFLSSKPMTVRVEEAGRIDLALIDATVDYSASQIAHAEVGNSATRVALWFALVAAEYQPGSLHPFQQAIRHLYVDDALYRIFRTRLGKFDGALEATDEIAELLLLTASDKRNILRDLPKWTKRWSEGRIALVRDGSYELS